MRFKTSQRQVFVSAYPMRPYPETGFGYAVGGFHVPGTDYDASELNAQKRAAAGGTTPGLLAQGADILVNAWKGEEDGGYYSDKGGYGWYYNDHNGSIDMVFAPGGGTRVTFYKDDPKWQGIYDAVVKGKEPAISKSAIGEIAKRLGGKETSGKSVSSTSSAGAPTAASVPSKAGSGGSTAAPKDPKGVLDTLKALPSTSWFLPAVGVLTVGGVIAIAFWPSKK